LLNAANVGSASGASPATNVAAIMASGHTMNYASGTVVVNNGPSATVAAGVVVPGGTPANADLCYCPTKASPGVTWGDRWRVGPRGNAMTRRSPKTFRRCSSAATAIEFGMIFLPLVLVVFGIMEFGRAMWTREALQQTAIAGARCMGLVQTACGAAGVYSASQSATYVQAQAAA
jgi:hypothetical protein